MVGISGLALVLLWAPGAAAAAARLAVDTTQPLGAVDPRFVSVTLDSGGLNRPLLQLAPRLADLGPSYFRVGGAAGDCIYWNVSNDVALPLPPPSARCKNEGSRRVASAEVVDALLTLCSRADKLLVLGLNSADGRDRTHHAWATAHTRALLRYLAAHPLRSVVGGFVRAHPTPRRRPSLPT